ERFASYLKSDHIARLGDLVQRTEADLLRIPNFGREALNEVKEALVQNGMHLGMEVSGWRQTGIENVADHLARVEFLEGEISAICKSLTDPWSSAVVALASRNNRIIDDEERRTSLYLENLEMLWRLGLVGAERDDVPH